MNSRVERRQESRLETSVAANVTVLGPSDTQLPGQLVSLSSRGARLLVNQALPLDSAVRVDLDDAMLLGEVRWCSREDSGFAVGLSVEHWLPSLSELASMSQEVIGADSSANP